MYINIIIYNQWRDCTISYETCVTSLIIMYYIIIMYGKCYLQYNTMYLWS